jgi:hypothetical protein
MSKTLWNVMFLSRKTLLQLFEKISKQDIVENYLKQTLTSY